MTAIKPPLLVCAQTVPQVRRCLICEQAFAIEAAVVCFVVGNECLGTLCPECGLSGDDDRRVFDACNQRWQR